MLWFVGWRHQAKPYTNIDKSSREVWFHRNAPNITTKIEEVLPIKIFLITPGPMNEPGCCSRRHIPAL